MSSEQEYRKIFKDANTDGKAGLSMDELTAYIKSVNPKLAERFASKAFSKMDSDGSKTISEDEFVKYMLPKKK